MKYTTFIFSGFVSTHKEQDETVSVEIMVHETIANFASTSTKLLKNTVRVKITHGMLKFLLLIHPCYIHSSSFWTSEVW